MRPTVTALAFALTLLTSSAHADQYDVTVETWFHRFLGHHANHHQRHDLACQLRNGVPAISVEAHILASPEYYARHGNSDWGFVKGLYLDVAGRPGHHHEVHYWMNRLHQVGSRHRLAVLFIEEGRGARVIPAYNPAPVEIYQSSPVYSLPTVRPVVPVYPATPGFSISVGYSRR